MEKDEYYIPGDFIGKLGVERSYEKQLRGEKGIEILLRDARGRIQGNYMDGKFDKAPVAGKKPATESGHRTSGAGRTSVGRKNRKYCSHRTIYRRSTLPSFFTDLRSSKNGRKKPR